MLFAERPVLADLDGTTIAVSGTDALIWTSWAKTHGIDPEQFILDTGRGVRAKIADYAPHLDAAAEAHAVAALQLTYADRATATPGAAELLARPRLCVVTSTDRRVAVSRLAAARLPTGRPIVAADDVERGKPDPEPYIVGAQRLFCGPEDCLAVEDSEAGVASAFAAGVGVIVGLPSPAVTADALMRAGAHVILVNLALLAAS